MQKPFNKGEYPMSIEQNKAVIHRLYTEVWNQKNAAVVDELFTPDIVFYRSGRAMLQGSETLKQWVENYARTTWGDSEAIIEDLVAEGDRVVTRFTVRGSHEGEWRGIPPTGKPVTVTGIVIHRFAGDRIAELWGEENWLGVMEQLGAIPMPA
jgi:steroid delta-isomerase-like uncharacterized protein